MIIDQGIERFPNSINLKVWKQYFNYWKLYKIGELVDEYEFAKKINSEINKVIEIDHKQENYYRLIGFKPEYLIYYHFDSIKILKDLYPSDLNQNISKLKEFVLYPKTCLERYINDYIFNDDDYLN
jgi:hypothetical protein